MKKNRKPKLILNERIIANEVRLLEEGGSRVLPLNEAIQLAQSLKQDLILVSTSANPPLCKISEAGKFLYDQKKNSTKPVQIKEKEIKMGPNIDPHDLNVKLEHVVKFIKAHYKVRISIELKGRELSYPDLALSLMRQIIERLEDCAKPDREPALKGRKIQVYFQSKK